MAHWKNRWEKLLSKIFDNSIEEKIFIIDSPHLTFQEL